MRTIIPFGPQHPVLPEPIHLDLVLEDEKVIEAIPRIGFIHRGLEKLVEKKDYQEFVYVAERICGICAFIHGLTYSLAAEKLMNIEAPRRAQFLRVIWSEIARLQSHLLWMGLMADAFGFESLFMHSWRIREKILNIIEETTGGRVIFSSCKVGGVRYDIDNDTLKRIVRDLKEYEKEMRAVGDVFLKDSSVRHRLCGVGVLSKEEAYRLGAVGPMLRASNFAQDLRQTGYCVYGELDFAPVVHPDGDAYARCAVRIGELYQSISLIAQAVDKIEEGPIDVKLRGFPTGECFVRTEQPRGEVIYYAKANGTKFLERLRVRTPTFANIPALLKCLPGCELADVPVLVLTVDPCISCTER